MEMLVVFLAAVAVALAQPELQFVCYNDVNCADREPRPVFTLGDSVQSCCGMPDVVSALDHSQSICTECGPPTLERISPEYIVLNTPETLVIEIQATRFSAVTWIHNGTAMHDFPRLELDNFSKTLRVTNTTVNDSGVYEADVHIIGGGVLTTSFVVAQYDSPSVSLSHSELLPGSQFLVLTCTAQGYPPPSITFGQGTTSEFGNTTTSTQVIPIVNITEEVVYTCRARNYLSDGTETTVEESVTLNPAQFIPAIASNPLGGELSVTLPSRIELSCTLLSGIPTHIIEWFKDGLPFQEMAEEGRVIVESNSSDVSTLLIEVPMTEDRGRYTCIFTNSFGSSSADFVVSVFAPPNVTAWPEEIIVNMFNVGRTVMFICEAFGYPLPRVTWNTFEGEVLDGYCNGTSMVEGEADYDYSGGQDYEGSGATSSAPPRPTEIIGEAILTLETTPPSLSPVTTDPMTGGERRPRDCSIIVVGVGVDTVQSILTINDANMEPSTTFVCSGENGINNFIETPQTDSVDLTITASPFYQTRPRRETNTILSLYVEISCVVVDDTPPIITWYRESGSANRELVIAAGRTSISTTTQTEEFITVTTVLAISNVQTADSATYTCQVESQNGINVASSTLLVRVPANITGPPQDVDVQNGQNATFSCQAFGLPMPTIQWAMFDDGNLIFLDSFASSETVTTNITTGTLTSLLQIENVQPTDEGEYVCLTSNGVALSNLTTIIENATAVLSITEPAVIAITPLSVSTTAGDTVLLACSARGPVLPTVTWSYEGVPLTCIDRNFCYDDQNTDYESSLDCEFLCNFLNASTTVILTIFGVAMRDSGSYICEADFGFGNVISANATLLIQREPPEIEEPDMATTFNVTAPEEFILPCTATGMPPPAVVWLKDGTQLSVESQKYSIETVNLEEFTVHSELTVQNTELTDQGQYTCIATNSAGSDSSVFAVSVHTAPSINVSPLSANETFPGGSAEFTCTGAGSPLPQVTWAYEGTPIETCSSCNAGGEGDTCALACERLGAYSLSVTLLLADVTPNDAGNYTCTVSNQVDSVTATASLDVDVFPLVIVQPLGTDFQVDESQFITLLCEAYGFPTPEVTWLRNTTVITVEFANDDKHTIMTEEVNEYYVRSILNISEANPNLDQGEYKCRIDNHVIANQPVIDSANIQVEAINDCQDVNNPTVSRCDNNGTCLDEIDGYVCLCSTFFTGINCNEPVEVIEVPRIVRGPEAQTVLFLQPVNVTCNATGQPPPMFSWYKDDVFVTNTSVPVLTIIEALPSDRGEYTCTAHNAFGSSDRSAPGLLSIRNVLQYTVRLTECQALESQDFQDFVTEISDFIAGRRLNSTDGTIYSASPVPVRSGQPPQDRIIITVVTSSGNHTGLADDLLRTAAITELQRRFECQFSQLERFDGCGINTFTFNNEYNEIVPWPESDIGNALDRLCPCGSLNISMYEERLLTRNCGGTFTYGAEWIGVISNCDYSNHTFQLCGSTKLEVPEQLETLEEITTASEQFTALDFAIASTIMQTISDANPTVGDEELQRSFTSIFDELLQTGNDAVAESQRKYFSASSLLETLPTFARRIELDENTAIFKEELLQIQIENTQPSLFDGRTFNPDFSEQEIQFQEDFEETPLMGARITLPENLLEELELRDQDIRILNYALLSDALFVLDESTEQAMEISSKEVVLGNIIIAASLSAPVVVQNLEEPIIIRFNITEALTEMNTTNVTCVFWETPRTGPYGKWSEDGCRLIGIDDDDTITCECSHLTHFGILMDINPSPNEAPGVEQSLQIISYIGISLSIICLIIIIATYLLSRKLRTRVVGQLLVHMCCALTLLYVAFLVAMHGQYYGNFVWFCYATSSVLHYSILVYFMWTVTEAIHLYLKLVKVFNSDISHFVLKASFINWGVPIVIVAICTGLGIHYDQWAVFIDDEVFFCRPVEWPFYIGLLVPFGLAYILDWSLFLVIMCSLVKQFRERNKLSDTNVQYEYKKLVVIAICLSIMFGFGWIFAFIVPVPSRIVSTIAQYLFSIFIGFQGVMIYVLHGVRSADARNEWKRWFYRIICCLEKPSELVSSSATKRSSPKQTRKQYGNPVSTDEERKNPLFDSTTNPNTTTTYLPDYDTIDRPEGSEHEFQTFEVAYNEQSSSEEEETAEIDLHDLSKIVFPSKDGD